MKRLTSVLASGIICLVTVFALYSVVIAKPKSSVTTTPTETTEPAAQVFELPSITSSLSRLDDATLASVWEPDRKYAIYVDLSGLSMSGAVRSDVIVEYPLVALKKEVSSGTINFVDSAANNLCAHFSVNAERNITLTPDEVELKRLRASGKLTSCKKMGKANALLIYFTTEQRFAPNKYETISHRWKTYGPKWILGVEANGVDQRLTLENWDHISEVFETVVPPTPTAPEGGVPENK